MCLAGCLLCWLQSKLHKLRYSSIPHDQPHITLPAYLFLYLKQDQHVFRLQLCRCLYVVRTILYIHSHSEAVAMSICIRHLHFSRRL